MMDKMITVEKNTSHPIGDKVFEANAVEMIEWLANHGYKAKKAKSMGNGSRICWFGKEGCKTEYVIYC